MKKLISYFGRRQNMGKKSTAVVLVPPATMAPLKKVAGKSGPPRHLVVAHSQKCQEHFEISPNTAV